MVFNGNQWYTIGSFFCKGSMATFFSLGAVESGQIYVVSQLVRSMASRA